MLLMLVVLAAAGCGGSETRDAVPACPRSGPECVVIPIGQPIYLGTLLWQDNSVGQDSAASVDLAVDYLDGGFDGVPGQLLGHDVALLQEDEGCTPIDGRIGARRLVEEPSLLAVVGTSCSGSALGAAASVLAAHGVLLVSPSNTAPGLTSGDTHDRTYFRTSFNDLIQASVDADFAYRRNGWTSAAAVHLEGNPYTTQLASAFGDAYAALGGDFRGDIALGGATTPAVMARDLARLDPDVIFLVDQVSCVESFGAIRANPALRHTPVVVPDACQVPEIRRAFGDDIPDLYGSGPDFSTVKTSAFYRDAYLPAYRRLTGGDTLGVFHPQAWDAINLLFDAIRRAAVPTPGGGLVIEREALRRAMLVVQGYDGLSGRLTCGTLGDCAESARIAVYRYPDWPVNRPDAKPVFSQLKTLAQVASTG